jgi:hypothetical protein
MAEAEFSQAEYDALRANLKSQAKTWSDYMDYAYDSEVYKGTLDPSMFRREHEAIGAQRQQQLGASTRTNIDREISQGYARSGSGTMGSRDKAIGRHVSEDAARRARILGEVEAAGDVDIEENDARWRGMTEKAGALKSEVLSAQQQLSVRLGEHGRKEDFWYYETSPEVLRFYESSGMNNAEYQGNQKADRERQWKAAQSSHDPNSYAGHWGSWMRTGDTQYLPQ